MNLSDIRAGQSLKGIAGGAVTVISAVQFGDAACQVVYRNADGSIAEQVLYSAEGIEPAAAASGRAFSAPGDVFKLVAEAKRIGEAYLFDPYFAVHSSSVEPLPHQISAVYGKMLQMHPIKFVLADDPGAGKTIMAGLLLKELMLRADVKRALIVAPANLVEQWRDELAEKFGLHFGILTNEMLASSPAGNAFLERSLLIARLDALSRNEAVKQRLAAAEWDIVIIDEAHKLSANVSGNKVGYTLRYQLGQLLVQRTRHFLLLTATPHSGNTGSFLKFMSLVDEDRFQCHSENSKIKIDVSDVMRRLVKEDLLKFDGAPLFPQRIAQTAGYLLEGEEQAIYGDVTEYVRKQFDMADRLKESQRNAVGFALTVLQRRLASSPEAIFQSLRRRRERLCGRLDELRTLGAMPRAGGAARQQGLLYGEMPDADDYDDLPEDEAGNVEEILDSATAAKTVDDLEVEIGALKGLEARADLLRKSGKDKKWEELSRLLQAPELKSGTGAREKIIIFTEHKDTLRYLEARIKTLLGSEAVVAIHGGMAHAERKRAELVFRQDKAASVLVATDAAGEGINLQCAHLMINYDIPWNPNRIEQRFGRIHRIGQREVCRLWNLVAENTREGDVFKRLFDKLNIERDDLGGKVFDVLGRVTFNNRQLKDLLIEAIRSGDAPAERAKITRVVDASLDTERLRELIGQYSLSSEVMGINQINQIKEDMERRAAARLQPFYIQAFFENAMKAAGGLWHARGKERLEITRVPPCVIGAGEQAGHAGMVLKRYESVCFKKEAIYIEGKPDAELLAPGHPLLDALIAWARSEFEAEFNDGAVLVSDKIDEPRLMCAIDIAFRDGEGQPVFRQMRFVGASEGGNLYNAGFAPYLDCESVKPEEAAAAAIALKLNKWLRSPAFEEKARAFAITDIIPHELSRLEAERSRLNDKIADQVERRLTSEINYWDRKSREYKEKMKAKGDIQALRLNAAAAEEKAVVLEARKNKRLRQLERGKRIAALPPAISAVAAILPRKMIAAGFEAAGEAAPDYGIEKKAVELAAMRRVMEIERSLGYAPKDVSCENRGYDIESFVPEELREGGYSQRFIEVKGRSAAHDETVTVSRNEILAALNVPDQFILALVTVSGSDASAVYIKKPFDSAPDSSAASVNFAARRLMENGKVVFRD